MATEGSDAANEAKRRPIQIIKQAILTQRKKPKLNIPRGPDNKPLKWIEGMSLCKCRIGGGKHLRRDCPKLAQEKAAEANKKAAAAAEAKKVAAEDSGQQAIQEPERATPGSTKQEATRNLTQVAQIEMGQVAVHRVVGDTYDIHDRDMRRKRRRILTRRETAENAQSTEGEGGSDDHRR